MDRKIEEISRKLGAKVIGTVPGYSAGAFGVAKLARTYASGSSPAAATGPDRPSVLTGASDRRSPLAAETEDRLSDRGVAEAQRF